MTETALRNLKRHPEVAGFNRRLEAKALLGLQLFKIGVGLRDLFPGGDGMPKALAS